MGCGIGLRHGSDLALLRLWCRLAAAALIWPLAWELPYAPGWALKKKTKKKKKRSYLNESGCIQLMDNRYPDSWVLSIQLWSTEHKPLCMRNIFFFLLHWRVIWSYGNKGLETYLKSSFICSQSSCMKQIHSLFQTLAHRKTWFESEEI